MLEIGGTENQGALVVRESIDEFSALAADVVLIGILVADIELRTVEVFLRDDVNNATHGIRTVGCAVTILQDVDVIHRAEWHRVQITGGGAATVDERQGRQATQANEGPTAAAVDERFVVVARTVGSRDEFQVAADRLSRGELDLRARVNIDWQSLPKSGGVRREPVTLNFSSVRVSSLTAAAGAFTAWAKPDNARGPAIAKSESIAVNFRVRMFIGLSVGCVLS